MLIDCHMHTPLCGHARGHPREYVRAAADKGIGLVTFTCHCPAGNDPVFRGAGIRMERAELPAYSKLIAQAAREGERLGVRVLRGIEAEVYPDTTALGTVYDVIDAGAFDYVLGSLHHQLPGFRAWLVQQGITGDRAIIDTYFRELTAGVLTRRYDSIAHPDVIRIYGTVQRFEPSEHEETIHGFLQALVDTDTCMEVNTSGLIKGAYKVHPDPEILAWAVAKGVSLTLGSDAHSPEQVGQHFDTVVPMLRNLGFKQAHYFERRQRCAIDL